MKEYVLVPQEDIDALEAARATLCNELRKNRHAVHYSITGIMWKIAHTKYQKAVNFSENADPATGD